jgi:hypothetical protein
MKLSIILSILLILLINISLFADWTELQKILASDGYTDDFFGRSVALDGDYAVIGADVDDDNGSASGSVYIFHRTDNVWTEQAKITASDGEQGDLFGKSVSIDGNYIIVGANWSDDNGEQSGSAYIFHRNVNTWSEVTKLTASNAGTMDQFGYSVSISGNYAVIGAYKNEVDGIKTGSAYVFKRTGHNWTEQIRLNASDGEEGDLFGFSVSLDGKYIVVGAYDADDAGYNPSYIFRRFGNVWYEQAILSPNDATSGDCFGKSVSISGNYALIGAYGDDDNGSSSGSAYIFNRTGTNWTQQAKITPSDGSNGDNFGLKVSISGNYALISAYHDDDYGSNSGSAYIFNRDGSIWSEQQKLTASDGGGQDLFGSSVCIDGDYGIIGAMFDDDNGEDSGSAYIFQNERLSIGDENIKYSTENLQLNNYPNPFNPKTTIAFDIKEGETGLLTIFNVKGQKIISESFVAGKHEFKWIADNNTSGVYFYKLQTESYSKINKMLMLK